MKAMTALPSGIAQTCGNKPSKSANNWFSGRKVTIFLEKNIKQVPKKRLILGYLKRNT